MAFVKDANGEFVTKYREAKMLTMQIMLNLTFVNKAEAGAQLDKINKRLDRLRKDGDFDVLRAGRDVAKINADIDVIMAAYKNGTEEKQNKRKRG